MKKKIIIWIALFIIVFSACKEKKSSANIEEYYPVTTVIKIDTSTFTDYVSEIHAVQNVEIRARVSGYLEKIFVDEGAIVKKGQLLFSINKREYLEEFAKAKALFKSTVSDVDAAQLEYKNVLQLAEKKIVSSTEVALAKNKLEAQKAKMDEASAHQSYVQIKLSNTEIRAPFDGIINRIPYKIGSLIDEGTLLTSISDNDFVYAYFDVSEKEYLNYVRNLKKDSMAFQAVSLVLADGIEHSYKGLIETVEGVIDENTGNIAFRAKFPNPEKIIKHGASGKVRLFKKYSDVVVVPQKSTFELQDKLYLFIVDKSNRVKQRNIEYVARLPHLFIVSKGVVEGERIIYEGIQNVKSDMIIKPQELSMRQIIKQLAAK